MILLSQQGFSAAEIAGLLAYDPSTVRRWIHRYHHGPGGLADRPRSGRPRLGSPRLGQRILRLLGQPKAWTIGRLWKRLGRPAISLRTLHRRVAEVAAWRRPRLVAKGDPDPDRDQVLAALHRTIAELPDGAVLLAEDEAHINLLAWVRSTWIANGQRQQVMTLARIGAAPSSARSTLPAAALPVPGGPQGRQRQLHRLLRAAAGRLPRRTRGGGDLRQRDHPPLQDRAAVAAVASPPAGAARRPLQPP